MLIREYNKQENPKGKVLCIPGVFMNAECFEDIAGRMPEYHFVAVTLDGFHKGCDTYESLDQQCDKLIGMLETIGETIFDLAFGTSLGTVYACHLAATRPQLTIKKLWLDGAVVLYDSGIHKFERWVTYHLFDYLSAQSRKPKRKGYMGLLYAPEWDARTLEARQSLSQESLNNLCDTLVNYVIEPGIKVPIFLTYGSKEQNIKKNLEAVHRYYPNAIHSIEKGYPHMSYMMSKADEYADRLKRYIG